MKAYKEFFHGREKRVRKPLRAIIQNLLSSYLMLILCQLVFIQANRETYATALENNEWWMLIKGNFVFATSAVCYLNAPYIFLTLFPLHYKEGKAMQCITKWAFILPNAAGVIANLCDCIYVRYTGRRTTWDIFNEFSNDGNIGKVIGIEVIDNIWLLAVGITLLFFIYRLYTPASEKLREQPLIIYYIRHTALLVLFVPAIIIGIRGGVGRTVRPITLSNANAYVSTPGEASFAVNYANETYRYYKGEHILLYDGESDTPLSMFNLRNDIMMKNNILHKNSVQNDMIRELKAIIQQYMERMTANRLTIENDTIK